MLSTGPTLLPHLPLPLDITFLIACLSAFLALPNLPKPYLPVALLVGPASAFLSAALLVVSEEDTDESPEPVAIYPLGSPYACTILG